MAGPTDSAGNSLLGADPDGDGGGGSTSSNPLAGLPSLSPSFPVSGAPDTSALGDILGSANPGAFDPGALGTAASGGGSPTDILSLLSLLGGSSGTSGTPGLGGLLGGGSAAGNLIAQLLGPLFGINQGASSAEGGQIGGIAGGALGSLLGPLGSLGGSAIGDLLGNLLGGAIGGGLDKFAKPGALAGSLESSGNPLEALLGRYINQGVNRGYDLSAAPGAVPFNPRRFGSVLEMLSGTALPRSVGGNLGFQNPVTLSGWENLAQINNQVPNATHLTTSQIQQLYPEIALLVNRNAERGNIKGLLTQENALAAKLKAAESY